MTGRQSKARRRARGEKTASTPSQRPSACIPAGPHRGRLDGRLITLCVTGSIAAFKAPTIARLLRKEGAEVQVVLSRAAREFIGPATFAGITGRPVLGGMFDPGVGGEQHVDIGTQSSAIVIAPATADLIARMAAGRANDAITASALCAKCRVMVAPAMHPAMWMHPATQRNLKMLQDDDRIELIGPVHGEVATGETGMGRMAEPEQIADTIVRHLSPGELAGRYIVVTAGPTVEDLDPVRFLGNRSSGKMGFALAERAASRGAQVTLIAGPVTLPGPYGVHRVDVRGAVAMRSALWQALGPDLSKADALLMAAAVADYRPAETFASKLKRGSKELTVELVQNPDLLAEVGEARAGSRPVLVGFAVETDLDDRLIEHARGKLESKQLDLVVANHADDALERDSNRATLVRGHEVVPLGKLPKGEVAERILDWVTQRLAEPAE